MRPATFHSNPKIKSLNSSSSDGEEGRTSLVLSHGAFQTQYHYHLYLDAIRKTIEFDRVIVPEQLSAGSAPPVNCFEIDVASIHTAITTELRQGRDVLLVAHSYGGIPGCEALAGIPQSPAENDGKPVGRILGIVFVSAFVAEQGQSLITSYHKRADWVRIEVCLQIPILDFTANISVQDNGLCYVKTPGPSLYSSVSSSSMVSDFVERVVPQAAKSFAAETKHEVWKEFPCYYIRCTEDRAMLVAQQDFFIARLRRLAKRCVVVKDLPSDHAPFACMPEKLADLTEEIVSELRGAERLAVC